jgi:DNA-binding GntR family transcriptional regulator
MEQQSIRIVPKPVREQAEEALRHAIVSGRYPPGTHLSDRAICEELGVSRSIIREAIRLLAAEGLVMSIPHRGTFVAFMSSAEAVQIYEVRSALEALAGKAFATRASDQERRELRAVVEQIAQDGMAEERGTLLELKQRFYSILLQGSRNAYVARMLDQLLNRNMSLRATSLSDPDRLQQTVAELRKIVERIEDRDGDGAAEACLAHVRAAEATALRVLRSQEATDGAAKKGPTGR